jgi:hypothetical protein
MISALPLLRTLFYGRSSHAARMNYCRQGHCSLRLRIGLTESLASRSVVEPQRNTARQIQIGYLPGGENMSRAFIFVAVEQP